MTRFSDHPLWPALGEHLTAPMVRSLSPAALAYLGDAVFELFVRSHYLFPPRRIADFHRCVVAQVRAEQQAEILAHLLPQLTSEEKEWVRRGRNSATFSRRAEPDLYRAATGLETLLGYLYLTDAQRLEQLLAFLDFPPA